MASCALTAVIALDLRLLAQTLLFVELDLFFLLRALAFELARDLRELELLGLGGEGDFLVAFGLLDVERARYVGELLFSGFGDQGNLSIAPALFQRELLLDLGQLAFALLLDEGEVALGAHLLERLLVLDLLLLDRDALVENIDLLLTYTQSLFVRHVLVLLCAGKRFLTLDIQQLELCVQLFLLDGDSGALLRVVHLAAGSRCYLRDDLQTFGIEHIVGAEVLLGRLLHRDDGDLFQRETVGLEALGHAVLDGAREDVPVLVQLVQGPGRRVAAQRADDLRLEQVADLLGFECLLTQAPARGQHVLGVVADVSVELGYDVHSDLVGGEDGLILRAADDELDRLQRDPGHLVEHRQHQRTLTEADLGAAEARAYEAHVGRRPLVDPYRQDVHDRDDDDRQNEHSDQEFSHGPASLFAGVFVVRLVRASLWFLLVARTSHGRLVRCDLSGGKSGVR